MPSPEPSAAAGHDGEQTARRGPSDRMVIGGASVAAGWVALWLALQLAGAAGWMLALLMSGR